MGRPQRLISAAARLRGRLRPRRIQRTDRHADPGGYDRAGYGERAGYGDTSYGDQSYRHQYGPYGDGRAREGQQHAPAPRRGPQWVGPQGVPSQSGGYGYDDPTGSAMTDFDDDDDLPSVAVARSPSWAAPPPWRSVAPRSR